MKRSSRYVALILACFCLLALGTTTADERTSEARPAGAISLREVRRHDFSGIGQRTESICGVRDIDGDGQSDIVLASEEGIRVLYSFASDSSRMVVTPLSGSSDNGGMESSARFFHHAIFQDLDDDGDVDLIVSYTTVCSSGLEQTLDFYKNTDGELRLENAAPMDSQVTHLRFRTRDGMAGMEAIWEPSQDGIAESTAIIWIPLVSPFKPGIAEELFVLAPNMWVRCAKDLNSDGRLDYGIYDEADQEFVILLSSRATDYASAASISTPARVMYAVLEDIDNDGQQDLVLGYPSSVEAFSLRDLQPSTHGEQIDVEFRLHAMGLADLDGDGWLDLLTAPANGQSIRFYRGTRQGFIYSSCEFIPSDPVDDLSPFNEMVLEDVDGDGFKDAVFCSRFAVHLMLNSSSSAGTSMLPLAGAKPVLLEDLDGDGDLDILSHSIRGFTLFENLGGGQFVPEAWGVRSVGDCVAVYNSNGVWLLHATSQNSASLELFSRFGQSLREVPLGEIPQGILCVGDLDGDHQPDVAGTRENGVWILWGGGELVEYELAKQVSLAAIADLQGDGLSDMLIARADERYHIDRLVFDNRNLIGEEVLLETSGPPTSLVSADLDQDGIEDLAVLSVNLLNEVSPDGSILLRPEGAEISFIYSAGKAVTAPIPSFPTEEIPYPRQGMVIGHFDTDELVDIALTSSAGSGLYLLSGAVDGLPSETTEMRYGAGALFSGDIDGHGCAEIVAWILGYPSATWVRWNGGQL